MARTRRLPSERILIAADVTELADVVATLRALPENTYGQVFIEATFPDEIRALPAPGRVTVHWLLRSSRGSELDALVFADRGEPLARTLVAWAAEWESDDPADAPTLVWIGCEASPWIEQVRNLLEPSPINVTPHDA